MLFRLAEEGHRLVVKKVKGSAVILVSVYFFLGKQDRFNQVLRAYPRGVVGTTVNTLLSLSSS